jgi:hypothetical protein
MLDKQEQALKLKVIGRGFNRTTRCFAVREAFAHYFPIGAFGDYSDFVKSTGTCLKAEPRTRVTLLCQQGTGPAGGTSRDFVLKTYHYPFFPRFRTGFRISKAEQEYNALLNLARLGIPAAEPVAFGVEKTLFGFVRSCFLMTVYVGKTSNLSSHRKNNKGLRDKISVKHYDVILRQTGERLRRLHHLRFFLFTPKDNNILLQCLSEQSVETLFIDVPYVRTLRWWPLARWAQKRDLAVFLGSFLPYPTDSEHAPFYEAYLPDPLGGSAQTLVRRVGKAIKVKQNKTLVSSWVHRIKRILRKRASQLKAGLAAE